MKKFYDVYEDGTATVSFYPTQSKLEELGYSDVFQMNDDLETSVKINYPGLDSKDMAQFDPESAGFMVYCATEDIAEVVNEELINLIEYRYLRMSEVEEYEGVDEVSKRIKEIVDQYDNGKLAKQSMILELGRLVRKEFK